MSDLLINNSETQLIQNYLVTVCAYSLKKLSCLNENYFSVKLFRIFSFKIDSITLNPNPNWAKILDPNPNSIYLHTQHCTESTLFISGILPDRYRIWQAGYPAKYAVTHQLGFYKQRPYNCINRKTQKCRVVYNS